MELGDAWYSLTQPLSRFRSSKASRRLCLKDGAHTALGKSNIRSMFCLVVNYVILLPNPRTSPGAQVSSCFSTLMDARTLQRIFLLSPHLRGWWCRVSYRTKAAGGVIP
ncbi:uncharacterized protein LACBIDRAFT_303356 [Laccaria bicolor S238N-H82]|uniref:Predicted protein n=1 Tax=Laccaria bicolor (strain S238N-H82 / ATCC MYA-4686) TaxID=486041 RepID=B0DJD5_LACBS|nr:uncharacterized protein LACBIDRAFT_303356 [Laccaria bicolor S238N-H82]EDR05502.1 predicted protein [Laccaria bicolor S238N-H82]|eukprot:XP_001884060.1 predicted protein [Laccaria bicolor S238N-H82]